VTVDEMKKRLGKTKGKWVKESLYNHTYGTCHATYRSQWANYSKTNGWS